MSEIAANLTISRIARAARVNVETIRYYQRRGLIAEPPKPALGYRIYPSATIERIRFIKRAQELGFTLAEIGNLLALGDAHCRETCALAEHKLDLIEDHIQDLLAMQGVLRKLVQSCKQPDRSPSCPLVRALAEPGA